MTHGQLPILEYPDPRLKKVAAPVHRPSPRRSGKLVRDMAETMYAAPGVGLAATQVDVHKRVIVIDISEARDELRVFINPELLPADGEAECEEGCLSVPGYYDKVTAPRGSRVRAQERARRTVRAHGGRSARRCIQHEMDHLRRQGVRRLPVAAEARAPRGQAAQEAAAGRLTRGLRRRDARRLCRHAGIRRPRARRVARSGYTIPLVLTQPDRPSGRGMRSTPSPVKRYATEHGLPCCSRRVCGPQQRRPRCVAVPLDVLVVAAYGLILPQAVLDWPRHGCLNIHASLLPRWRGAAPIQRAIEAGDTATGITIMQMDAGLDTGPMLDAPAVADRRRARPRARCTTSWPPPARRRSWRLCARWRATVTCRPRPSPQPASPMRRRSDRRTRPIDWSAAGRRDRSQGARASTRRPARRASRRARVVECLARGSRFAARSERGAGDRRRGRARPASMSRAARHGAAPDRTAARGWHADDGGAFAAGAQLCRVRASTRAGLKAVRCTIEQLQAARAVTRVLGGVRLRDALAAVDDGTALRGRALVQELAYGTLRHWGTLDAIAGALAASRSPIRCCARCRGRALPARSHASAAVRRRRPRSRRRRCAGASAGEGARQRAACAATCASATR